MEELFGEIMSKTGGEGSNSISGYVDGGSRSISIENLKVFRFIKVYKMFGATKV